MKILSLNLVLSKRNYSTLIIGNYPFYFCQMTKFLPFCKESHSISSVQRIKGKYFREPLISEDKKVAPDKKRSHLLIL